LYFPEENPKQLDQDKIIEIFDQAKAPEWHEAMVNTNIDILKCLMKNQLFISGVWRTWRRSSAPTVWILLYYQQVIKICKSAINSVGKYSKNHKGSNMFCHYCDKNKHNTADCRAIFKFKQQKKYCFEAKDGPGKMSLAFPFEEINALNRQLKHEKIASSKKRKERAESILSTEIDVINSSNEVVIKKYLFTSSKSFSSRKSKLSKSYHPTNNYWVGSDPSLIVNNEEHLLRALADTGASSTIILEAYTSAPFIKTDDNNTTTWITMGGKFTTTNIGYICDIFITRVQSQETNVFFLGISCWWPLWVIMHIWYDYWQYTEIFLDNQA
jgi:hypothetical protein